MFIIETNRFLNALKAKGYRSIKDFAKHIGVHRNTIHYYLSGHRVFPANFEKILEALDLKPADILTQKRKFFHSPAAEIASLVDQLHLEFPNVTFVLFGSRVRGIAHKYSDWDIGVFSKDGLEHALYRRIVRRNDDMCADFPYLVEIINLNRADESFLREISKHWMFLSGRQQDWIDLQRRVAA
jgi:predicted nucleotidyltransferase